MYAFHIKTCYQNYQITDHMQNSHFRHARNQNTYDSNLSNLTYGPYGVAKYKSHNNTTLGEIFRKGTHIPVWSTWLNTPSCGPYDLIDLDRVTYTVWHKVVWLIQSVTRPCDVDNKLFGIAMFAIFRVFRYTLCQFSMSIQEREFQYLNRHFT